MATETANGERTPGPKFIRELGLLDAVLLGIGTIIGSSIFLTTGDVARSVPSGFWILAVWLGGGLVALAGALTYGELGGLFPKVGGQYAHLKEAYGSLVGFLYGWAFFFIIWNGANAAVAMGFSEYLSYLLPSLSFRHSVLRFSLGGLPVTVSGGQLTAALAIFVLTFVNYFGLKFGRLFQNFLTGLKLLLIALFVILGLSLGGSGELNGRVLFSKQALQWTGISAFGVGLIAAVWAYDGWFTVAFMAGEMKKAKRNIALSMILGISSVIIIYVLVNLVYLRVLPVQEIVGVTRIGEVAAAALFGPWGARLFSVVILISAFGCLNSCLISAPRVYYAMATDRLFFRKLAEIHPKYHSPGPAIVAQGIWSIGLCLVGGYRDLYEFVVFGALLFACLTGAAVFVLRRKYPSLERPFRTPGYPVTPLIFIGVNAGILVNMFLRKPRASGIGVLIILAGLPAYFLWNKKKREGSPRNEGEAR
jgi:APA family basic amino acid/polyamine antiporter